MDADVRAGCKAGRMCWVDRDIHGLFIAFGRFMLKLLRLVHDGRAGFCGGEDDDGSAGWFGFGTDRYGS